MQTAQNEDLTNPALIDTQQRSLHLLRALQDRHAQRLFYHIYPDEDSVWTGPTLMGGLIETGQIIHARSKYPKHMEFLGAGGKFRERCGMMANRVGKTFGLGGYEMSCHLTGQYPPWWDAIGGKRFNTPISAWAAGDTFESTRDIIQLTMLGEITFRNGKKVPDGRGIIPGALLGRNTWRTNPSDLVDTILVRHVSGRNSFLGFKSYDQGRKKFQGTGRHVIWFDEEPPEDVYNEALIRTATLNGLIMLTFTPLSGMSEVVLSFMPADQRPDLGEDIGLS